MNIFGFFDFSKIRTSPKLCLLLFGLGIVYGIGLDMLGVGTLTTEPVSGFLSLPAADYIILPAVYLITAAAVGLLSKNVTDAAVYGASLGQCQLFMPFILEVLFFHSGNLPGITWRMLCGLPLTAIAAAGICSIKSHIRKDNKK